MLNVWASWCITCRVEHPFLEEISKTIPIIGLNYKDEKNNATGWLNKLGDPYIFSLYDYYGELALDLGVTGAPETFLVYKGSIISHHVGEVNQKVWSSKFLSKINQIKVGKKLLNFPGEIKGSYLLLNNKEISIGIEIFFETFEA